MKAALPAIWALSVCLFAGGCESGTGGPPDAAPHAYLLLAPEMESNGWKAIDALRAKLPPEERRRIRTAGLVASGKPAMYIDFDGDCEASFVAAAQRIAAGAGVERSSCSATLPSAPIG